MLQAIRDRATGWIAYTIIILICIPFALWGVNSYFGASPIVDAATVAGDPISLQDVQRTYQQQRANLQRMLGNNFNSSLFDEDRLKQQALEQLIDAAVLRKTAEQQGMRVSDQQLGQAIHGIEAFQEDGSFSQERYERMVRLQGYSTVGFEESLRTDLMTGQLRDGLVESSLLTKAELEQVAALMEQKRDISYFVLPLATAKEGISVEESEITTYFDENKNRFMSPERVKVDYLELSLDEMAEDVDLTDEEIAAEYEAQLPRYTKEEQRSASHILFPVDAEGDASVIDAAQQRAQTLYDQIKAGDKTFADALAEIQADADSDGEGGELGVIFKGVMEPSFETALYELENVGDSAEPIQTSSGFHIIKLDQLQPEQVQGLDEVRAEIEQSLRLRQAESGFFDAAEQLANLTFEQPDSLQPAADELGLEIKQTDWLERSSNTGIAVFPKVKTALFSPEILEREVNTEALEVEPSHVIVMRKADYQAASPLSLEEARDDVVEQLKTQKAREILTAQLQELLDQARQGTPLAELAEQAGVELENPGLIGRDDGQVNPSILNEVFKLPSPQDGKSSIGSAAVSGGDQALLAVSAIEAGKYDDLDDNERDTLIQRMTQQLGSTQFNAFLRNQREQFDIVTFEDRL